MARLAASVGLLLQLLLVCCAWPSMAVQFSSLPKTLVVTASPTPAQVLYAGVDQIKVTWSLNQSLVAGADTASYKKVKVLLCYAPVSQTDRAWRKVNDDLKKDKTCQFKMTAQPYAAAGGSFVYSIERSIPTATYFVRAYALDGGDTQVAYGQTTDAKKAANLFEVVGITGRQASLDIAAGCFSAFSVAALVFFFVVEKKKAKK